MEARLIGGTELVASLGAFGPRLHARLVKTMTRETIRLQRHVKAEHLSGQTLRNRTGHLRASIGQSLVTIGAEGASPEIVGKVGIFKGPTVIYGRAHEFGFDDIVRVRGHTRTVKQAFGQPILPVEALVRPHTRHMKLPVRSFLRTSLAERQPEIEAALDRAVAETVASV